MHITTFREPDGQWTAIDEDSYDGAPEYRDSLIGGIRGYGSTAAEARRDLREQLEESSVIVCIWPDDHSQGDAVLQEITKLHPIIRNITVVAALICLAVVVGVAA